MSIFCSSAKRLQLLHKFVVNIEGIHFKTSIKLKRCHWTLLIASKDAARRVSHEFVLTLSNHHQIFKLAIFILAFFFANEQHLIFSTVLGFSNFHLLQNWSSKTSSSQFTLFLWNYPISSNKSPWRLLNFETVKCGAY